MARYHAAVESRRSATETFGYLATFSNAAEWDPGVLAGQQLDPGPAGAGSRFRLVVPFLGLRMSLTYEVIRRVPGHEVLLAATSGVLRSTDRIVVTGAEDRSMVSYEAEVRLRGPLQVLDPVLRPVCGAAARRAASRRGRRAMTSFGPAVDAALEACVVPGFSRIGLAVRSRLLPEYTADDHPGLDGRTILITGATSGIGYAAAVALARRGAAVHFLARDHGRAERARRGIAAASGSTSISYGLADLEDLDAVRAFARDFCATHDRLDVLIHNAGAIHPEFRTDTAGTELTIVGQVVAPFLLTRMLMPALLAAAPSRVITVSSGGMYTQRLDPATLQLPASRYRGVTAYARAKRAQVALSREWARRLAGTGVAFHAMHPGWVDTPGVAAALPGFRQVMRPILLSPEQGADTIVWLATAPQVSLGSGRFWHDRRARPEYPLPWTRETDPSTARKLWDHLAAATATDSPEAGAGRARQRGCSSVISPRGQG